jgi:hypothetical protein
MIAFLNEVATLHAILIVALLRQLHLLNCVYTKYSNNKRVTDTTGKKQQQISNLT